MGLSAKLLQIYRHLWTSYWCIPVALLLFAVLLAGLTTFIDHRLRGSFDPDFLYLRALQPETARVVLSMIAGSIIGVAGVVFSITMVAVSFASGTFGPRLIGNMMRDRGSQVSLGVFIGTFAYTLIVLRFVKTADGVAPGFTPYISTGTAMALAMFCMVVLIYFIHHVPETINIELIVAKLGRALKSGIESRFPRDLKGKAPLRAMQPHWIEDVDRDAASHISLKKDGYIQALDIDRLDRLAGENRLRIEIIRRPGAFVTVCDNVLAVWGDDAPGTDIQASLQECFAVGAAPTVNQNIEFVADQLVEIIARALSPGVNDPFTAIACVNWLQVGILHYAACEGLADSFNRTENVYAKPYLFGDFVGDLFRKAGPYILTDSNVCRHTLVCLDAVKAHLPPGSNRDTIDATIRDLEDRAGNERNEKG